MLATNRCQTQKYVYEPSYENVYQEKVDKLNEAIQRAMDRPCVPTYVYEAYYAALEAAESDSVWMREFIATAQQHLNSLEQDCGYLSLD